MPAQDTSKLKEKIIEILKRRGPSLPVHIAGETGLSILFASAFLSELISERKIKISFMRVGSSPIYFLPNQENLLEKFSIHLKSREKDAYILLKEKKFLIDSEQDPAIRVALRSIKDFAKPFKKNDEIIWRYFIINESDFNEIPKKTIEKPITSINQNSSTIQKDKLEKPIKNMPQEKPKQDSVELNIFDKKIIKKSTKKTQVKKRASQKKNEKFFNKVKEFLKDNSIEIVDIENFNKNDLILRIKIKEEEKLLIAYNKKRINEQDIINAGKRAQESNIPYMIMSLGKPLKKLEKLINALKNLSDIKQI